MRDMQCMKSPLSKKSSPMNPLAHAGHATPKSMDTVSHMTASIQSENPAPLTSLPKLGMPPPESMEAVSRMTASIQSENPAPFTPWPCWACDPLNQWMQSPLRLPPLSPMPMNIPDIPLESLVDPASRAHHSSPIQDIVEQTKRAVMEQFLECARTTTDMSNESFLQSAMTSIVPWPVTQLAHVPTPATPTSPTQPKKQAAVSQSKNF